MKETIKKKRFLHTYCEFNSGMRRFHDHLCEVIPALSAHYVHQHIRVTVFGNALTQDTFPTSECPIFNFSIRGENMEKIEKVDTQE